MSTTTDRPSADTRTNKRSAAGLAGMSDDFAHELTDVFTDEYDVDAETARAAAEGAAGFRADHDASLTVADVCDLLDTAPYDDFRHAFNWAIGECSASHEERPDTKPYRLTGFDHLTGERATT
jgi:hypothetical protein